MNPACGPPKPIGTPKRCEDPTATSAPISPGGRSRVMASRSAATVARAPRSWAAAITGWWSRTWPLAPGYCSSTPKISASGSPADVSWTMTGRPIASIRVRTTASVCGSTSASTTTAASWPTLDTRRISVTASAAAVASSSIEALAVVRPVSSLTAVWKFSSASSRPWEISGWYGV